MYNNQSNNRTRGYAVDEIAREPSHCREDDPPFVPKDVKTTREVESVLHIIAGMLVKSIEAGAYDNAIARMAFNIVSENGYCNTDFRELVKIAVLGVEVERLKNNRAHILDCAKYVVDRLTPMYLGKVADARPDLIDGHNVGQRFYDETVRRGRELVDVIRSCTDILDQASRSHNNHSYGGGYGGGYGGYNNNAHRAYSDGYGRSNNNTAFNGAPLGSHNSTNQSNGYAIHPQSGGSFAPVKTLDRQTHKAAEQNMTNINNPAQTDWTRTDETPYLLSYDLSNYKQIYLSIGDDVTQEIVRLSVDEKSHSVAYATYSEHDQWRANSKAVEEATAAMKAALVDSKAQPPEAIFKSGEIQINDKAIYTTGGTLRGAISDARVLRASIATETELKVFCTSVMIEHRFETVDLPESVRSADAHRFEKLQKQSNLQGVRDVIMSMSEPSKRLYLNRMNDILMDKINTILHHNLSLSTEFKMTNFIDDVDVVDGLIRKDYGTRVYESWKENIRGFIETLFSTVMVAEEEEGDNTIAPPKPLKYVETKDIVFLSMVSSELGIELTEGVSMAVSREYTPIMDELVTTLAEASDEPFRDMIFVTADCRGFVVTRGWLADNCYLIRKLPWYI